MQLPSIRSILFLCLSLAAPNFATSTQDADESGTGVESSEWREFLKVLDIPGDSLKAAIAGNLRPKYREGVFEDGHEAIEAVHNDDPVLASRLVEWAKQHALVKDYLRKRQSDNTTVTTTSSVVVVDGGTTETSFTTETTVVTAPLSSSSSEGQSTTPTPLSSSSPDASASSSVAVSTRKTTTTVVPVPVSSSSAQGQASLATTSPSSARSVPIGSNSPAQGSSSLAATTIPITTTNGNGDTTVTSIVVSLTTSTETLITQPTTEQSTQTGVIVPITVSSTAPDGSIVVSTTQAFETDAPTSVAVPIVTTNTNGETITTSSQAPAMMVTTTNAQGSIITTASPLSPVQVAPGGSIVTSAASMILTTDSLGEWVTLTRPTAGGVYTVTDARGSVAVITYRPGGGTVSQIRVQTTTLPNGQVTTITSFVDPGSPTAATDGGGPAPSPSSTNEPGLQSSATLVSPPAVLAAFLSIVFGVAAVLL